MICIHLDKYCFNFPSIFRATFGTSKSTITWYHILFFLQKSQALTQSQIQLEQAKSEMAQQELQMEAQIKKQLMDHEFQLNMQLKKMELDTVSSKEKQKEDRKDERTKIQASQQSELIDQRNNAKPPKNFESTSNDTMGGIDLGLFNA